MQRIQYSAIAKHNGSLSLQVAEKWSRKVCIDAGLHVFPVQKNGQQIENDTVLFKTRGD